MNASAVQYGFVQSSRPCSCGSQMVTARRIGPGSEIKNVACCFSCGEEHPSLYGRDREERNSGEIRKPHRPARRRDRPQTTEEPGAWMSGRLVLGGSRRW